jgi:hypothetical protein
LDPVANQETRETPDQLVLLDQRVKSVSLALLATQDKWDRRVRWAVRDLRVLLVMREVLELPVKLVRLAALELRALVVALDPADPSVISDQWVLLDHKVHLDQVDHRVSRDQLVSRDSRDHRDSREQ